MARRRDRMRSLPGLWRAHARRPGSIASRLPGTTGPRFALLGRQRGMEVLRCLTPQMVEKELWVNLLAYNLIRLLMAQAALEFTRHPRELSFKHTVQMWTQWRLLRCSVGQDWHRDTLLRLIVQVSVGQRPGRLEPRARKRQPKPYSWLKVPRVLARQQIRELGYLPNV